MKINGHDIKLYYQIFVLVFPKENTKKKTKNVCSRKIIQSQRICFVYYTIKIDNYVKSFMCTISTIFKLIFLWWTNQVFKFHKRCLNEKPVFISHPTSVLHVFKF